MNINTLTELRKKLHRNAELSGEEESTSEIIISELKKCSADEIFKDIGGFGVLAKFSSSSKNARQAILLRAELDAIPVQEETGADYSSENDGIIHGCGHDGHMAILIGVANELQKNRPKNIDIYLLFQPAEETGEGARRILKDKKFKKINVDFAFALHNLPGFAQGDILVKNDVFAAGSTGIELIFKGKSSHAAYPEQGINPSGAIADFLLKVNREFQPFRKKHPLNKAVNTFLKLGEPAFGISPGIGRIGFTLRSGSDEELQDAVDTLRNLSAKQSDLFDGEIEIRQVEPFAATLNDPEGVEIVKKSAELSGFEIVELVEAFPWSEDFGTFREICPITIFGLGVGEDAPPLHSEKYDFNDAVIEPGIKMFVNIINQYSGSE